MPQGFISAAVVWEGGYLAVPASLADNLQLDYVSDISRDTPLKLPLGPKISIGKNCQQLPLNEFGLFNKRKAKYWAFLQLGNL